MARSSRSNDWGFPRWRSYGASREAQQVRLCDRHGCDKPGGCPAPKSPNSPERWYFCTDHAAEYNRNWDYFQGLDKEEREQRERDERRDANGFQSSAYHGWGGPGDGSRSRDELHALKALELEDDADFEAVKKSWRRLAKENHPDVKPGDADAAVRFHTIQAAYEVLRSAEERRSWKPREAAD
ncbi:MULTISPECIES: J domain-containing protein [Sphingobium]|uniref:J domain-containing protein n=1 Tax=Sphingobium sp. MI1205 TaxID=407020 RepID=UPI00077006F7|nr:J domain-containing protein [Sphingobium sp. MI1205]AMK19174.1 heat shock protein DnaJ domain-containing protein [Sphingobium sp. MI1205]